MTRKQLSLTGCLIALTIITLVSGGCGCHDENYPSLVVRVYPTEDDRKWINYKKRDTIVFKNNSGILDTFIIGVNEHYEDAVEDGPYKTCKQYYEYYVKSAPLQNKASSLLGVIHSPNSNHNQVATIWWTDLIKAGNNNEFGLNFEPTDGVIINGATYDDVYIYKVDTLKDQFPHAGHKTWQIFFQKENGLLRYDQKGGISWEKVK